MITGNDLIAYGFKPGSWFKDAIEAANIAYNNGSSSTEIHAIIQEYEPEAIPEVSMRTNSIPFNVFLDTANQDEINNKAKVIEHVDAIMRLPTVEAAAVMPDAMPSGSALGTIPVGGVVATKGTIHPGMHSADICCSMAISVFNRDEDVSKVLDAAMKVTHFGWGKRSKSEVRQYKDLNTLIKKFDDNSFLKGLEDQAEDHFMTQGDGNHFLYVGHIESTGQLAVVTHHGSRGLGAQLYKRGMIEAKKHTAIIAPRAPEHNAWIDYESTRGEAYWDALQIIRDWTKMNHLAIHDSLAKRIGNKVVDRWWNEHNFVFLRDDKFYHAKGATPNYRGFSADDDGRTLVPLNMSEPILMLNHVDNVASLGFAPHGAGRNFSRTEHYKRLGIEFNADARGLSERDIQTVIDRETKARGIDARFFAGAPDLSEMPSSYKDANAVTTQIKKYNLGKVYDRVLPGGSIMAGELPKTWTKKKKAK